MLGRCLDYDEVQHALNSLPPTLDVTYSRILYSIPEQRREKAIRLLQFLTYSERPSTIEEAVDAIAVRLVREVDLMRYINCHVPRKSQAFARAWCLS